MSRRLLLLAVTAACVMAAADVPLAWGVRAHTWINRVAVRTLPDDGPVFLKAHEEWIGYLSVIPDAWRRPSEPFLKMLEDPNHGWFKEQFAFMNEIPRSRYEFVLKLYDEQQRLAAAGDPAATLTNVRWTGTMAYAAVEGYERMLSGMRRYRELKSRGEDTRFVELELAFYMGWTGHYTGDGAQPLHDTIHHDGWQGPNPKGYTTDPRVHGLFESRFVDMMELEGSDLEPHVPPARVLEDPFTAILAHLDEAGSYTEEVYRLEKSGALADASHAGARKLVIQQASSGAALLRDLAHTAWVRSGEPPVNDPDGNPITPDHPRYNPATGSAPAHVPVPGASKPGPRPERDWQPVVFADPVLGKNFYLFEAIAKRPEVLRAVEAAPDLKAVRAKRFDALARAAGGCGSDMACHADAFKWSMDDIAAVERALAKLAQADEQIRAFVAGPLRTSGMFQAYAGQSDEALLTGAWREAAIGLNRIVDVYLLGQPPLYPKIDSVSYAPASDSYRGLIETITAVLHERRDELTTFYAPALGFAGRLLDANRRDEAGRHEPLHEGENAAAYRRIGTTDFERYPYAAILVPGAGPDRPDVALDPRAKARAELAAVRYKSGRAPFIIVSGGYVHPNQTPFCRGAGDEESARARIRRTARGCAGGSARTAHHHEPAERVAAGAALWLSGGQADAHHHRPVAERIHHE